ncbi:MAG: hypothetical protein K6E52_10345 [Bacteroidaceae bacterium]|nr:hypothetical protein [Bacteroidaceae bacterium]
MWHNGQLDGKQWCNKGQLSHLVDAICRDFRQEDAEELKKLMEWQKEVMTKGAYTPCYQPALICQ